MFQACFSGNKETVSELIKNRNTDWNWGLYGACQGGHKDLALLMINKGAEALNWGLVNACEGRHKELALLMIEKGADNWNLGLNYACCGGYKDLALLMIEKGANINDCDLELDEFDIEYLLDKKVKEFGRFKKLADMCVQRRKLVDQIFKELNLRDVDSIIYTY